MRVALKDITTSSIYLLYISPIIEIERGEEEGDRIFASYANLKNAIEYAKRNDALAN